MDEVEGDREEMFVRLADRIHPELYLQLREHFDEHLAEAPDKLEEAYLCLMKRFLAILDGVNHINMHLLEIMAGPDLIEETEGPPKE